MFPICTPFDGSDPAEETVVLMFFTLRANWVESGYRVVSMVAIASTSDNPWHFKVSSVRNLIHILLSFRRSSVGGDYLLASSYAATSVGVSARWLSGG